MLIGRAESFEESSKIIAVGRVIFKGTKNGKEPSAVEGIKARDAFD
ncbi:hypothetical protein AGMMS49936_10400 [Endomicrobiia bacterium]|nr:hypothetical protein AGMMS49936_10400 [Endomicrobiia bacterium]